MEQIPSEGSSYPNHNAWIGPVFSGNMTRHLAPVLVMLFGSCQLILFVSKTNYFQILKRQCCLLAKPFVKKIRVIVEDVKKQFEKSSPSHHIECYLPNPTWVGGFLPAVQ